MPTDRRQRQKELEAAKKAAEKKRASRRELLRRVWVAVGLGLAVAAFLILGNVFSGPDDELPEGYRAFRDQPVACGGVTPAEEVFDRFEEPPDEGVTGPVGVVVATSCGQFTVELDPALAPVSVNAFVHLARAEAYDGTVFHLVDPELWVQAGDPEADGSGTFFVDEAGRRSFRPPDEFPAPGFTMEKGVVGLVGDGTNRGSAFFVVTTDDSPLTTRVNVIGRVIDGIESLDAITAVATRGNRPTETIYIESVTVTEG